MSISTSGFEKKEIMKQLIFIFLYLIFSFKIFSQPVINSFSPTNGNIGSSVLITGSNFNTTPTSNTVYFGPVKSNVTAATSTSLTVTVPTGASYQPISVTTNNLSAYSVQPFNPTFSGPYSNFNTNSFGNKIDSISLQNPFSINTGDFDNDGKPDLITANFSSSNIIIYRNTSTNLNVSFSNQISIYTGYSGPRFVCINDFDNDGKLDLAVVNTLSDIVTIYRNISTPNNIIFSSPITVFTSSSPEGICCGDFDRDGKIDLAIVNGLTNNINIMKNTSSPGTISFGYIGNFNTGNNPHSIFSGDLDGDGKSDLVVANGVSNDISVLRNTSTTSSISFASALNFDAGSGPYSVTMADIDKDGKLDIACANGTGNTVSIFRNTSTTGNISLNAKFDLNVGFTPYFVHANDLDGDGKVDLMTSNDNANNISVLKNNSTVGNISFNTKVDYSTSTGSRSICSIDLNGDYKPDLITANYSSNTISILQNLIGTTLPLTLVEFKLEPLDNKFINLNWTTNSEYNTSHFEIEYSTDGINFNNLGIQKCFQTGINKDGKYTFLHTNPIMGSNYYRLKIIDLDKSYTYSKIIVFKLVKKSNSLIIYPNPASDFVTIKFDQLKSNANILLTDNQGKCIKNISLDKYTTEKNISLKGIPAGNYVVILKDNSNETQVSSIVIN